MRDGLAVLVGVAAFLALLAWALIATDDHHKARLRDCDKRHGTYVYAGDGVCVDSILVRY